MTDHPDWAATDLSSLKAISTGSQIVPPHLIERFVSRGVPVLQVYGSTETCPIAVYTRLGGDLSRAGSTGLPGLCCEAVVIDDAGVELPPDTPGEIAVRGPNVFFEYWGNAAATREVLREGWFRTGDIGRRDADGYFFVHDRKKNMIISGGENIYPAEVERVLLEHPDVADCGVIGRPDAKWDEVPVAYVIPRAGRRVEAETLKAHVSAQLARFKVPREFVFVEELPRTALGKVQHFRLKAACGRKPVKIAVLGGGNGSFAAAGDFALQGHDVRLWRRDAAAVAAHRAAGSRIVVKDSKGRHDAQLALVTTDIAEAVRDAELILCPAPAFAQHDIAADSRRICAMGRSCSCRRRRSAPSFLRKPRTTPAIMPPSRSPKPARCHG